MMKNLYPPAIKIRNYFLPVLFSLLFSPAFAQVNSFPVASDDTFSTNEDVTLNASSVLGNDTDPDNNINSNSVTLLTGVSHGALALNPDGTFTYIPGANFNGTDSFSYSVCDTGTPVYCDTAIVIITVTPVNDAPTANDDNYNTAEDNLLNGPTILVNDNDIDANLDPASATVVSSTTHGTLVMNGNGTFAYMPDANYAGNDTFTYSVCDLGTPVYCDTAMVIIMITPVNDVPVITGTSIQLSEDSTSTVCTPVSDTDPGDTLTATICGGPYNGTATVAIANGSLCVTYSPNANFNGPDSLCVVVCDDGTPSLCDTILIPIVVTPVNDAPVAINDSSSSPDGSPVNGSVNTNDSDPDGPGATYTLAGDPSHGALALGTNGAYNYTPGIGFNGCDTIFISVCDGGTPELCDTSMLVICVTNPNDPPVAQDDQVNTPEDSNVLINVKINDSDPDGNPLSDPTIVTPPNHGTATVNNDGTITYAPDTNYNGTDTFTYVICDGGTPLLCDTATVIVVVTPVDDAPDISVIPIVVPEDSSITVCFDYILDVPGGNNATVNLACNPENGTATLNLDIAAGQVCITYIPNADFSGSDSLCITLCDSFGVCTTVTIAVTVAPVDENCYWIKGFSPNGDGQNDAFYISCNDRYPDATLSVFSRWGDEVYRSEGHYQNNWYGRNMQDRELPDGTYWYIYDYKDGSNKKETRFVVINR